jgi:hypothetical protein
MFGQYDKNFALTIASFFLQKGQWPTVTDLVMNGMDYLEVQEKAHELSAAIYGISLYQFPAEQRVCVNIEVMRDLDMPDLRRFEEQYLALILVAQRLVTQVDSDLVTKPNYIADKLVHQFKWINGEEGLFRLYTYLQANVESPALYSVLGLTSPSEWSLTVSKEAMLPFLQVKTITDYLEMRRKLIMRYRTAYITQSQIPVKLQNPDSLEAILRGYSERVVR